MKNVLKIIGAILLVLVAALAFLLITILRDQAVQKEDQAAMVKEDGELLGTHLHIEREQKAAVDVNFYKGPSQDLLPLVVNLHGGAFIAGDADTLDTQSDRISQNWKVHVAAVNYQLLRADVSKEYVVEEIIDTVRFFIENSGAYHIDPNNIFLLGYSAGGYYAMASTLALHRSGIPIRGQILCYAFISDILEQYQALPEAQKETMPGAFFLLADGDPLSESSLDYQQALEDFAVPTATKVYQGVKHGFIEENNPEYEKLHAKNRTSKSPEAEAIAREAEDDIRDWIAATIQ